MLSNIISQMSGIITSGVDAVMDEQKTKTIETIIFQNLIRVNISPQYICSDVCQSLIFPTGDVPSTTVSYETLLWLYEKYRSGYNLSGLEERAFQQVEMINGALAEYPKEIQEILRSDILDFTHYMQYNLELWDITQLCIKYNITPIDIFVALVADASPFGMGVFTFPKTGKHGLAKRAHTDFKEKLNSPSGRNWFGNNDIYIDYWNGIGVKTAFPKDIQLSPMQVNIQRYNERNDYQGYNRIIKLFASRLSEDLAVETNLSKQENNNPDTVDTDRY
jgi:hypothetical protein